MKTKRLNVKVTKMNEGLFSIIWLDPEDEYIVHQGCFSTPSICPDLINISERVTAALGLELRSLIDILALPDKVAVAIETANIKGSSRISLAVCCNELLGVT